MAGTSPAMTRARPLDLSEQEQDEKNDEDQPDHARRPVAPAAAIRPGWKRAEQDQDQDDDENGRQHVASPWAREWQAPPRSRMMGTRTSAALSGPASLYAKGSSADALVTDCKNSVEA